MDHLTAADGRDGNEDGYFPPGSLLREVQSHRLVGQTYGRRALVLGATAPLPYVGTSSSTLAKERPFTRLAHTAKAFESIFFGNRAEADRVLAAVQQMHGRVRGALERDEGPVPAGTRYDAFDPALMLWTMGVLSDSSRVAYETLVRPLAAAEREELWAEWVRFGVLFGMPESVAPRSADAFEEWMGAHLAGNAFHVTDEARVVGRAILTNMPVPRALRPGMKVSDFLVLGMLPDRVRTAFGMAWTEADERRHRRLTAAVRRAHAVLPQAVTHGRNTSRFNLVVTTEQRIVERGRQSIVLPVR